MNINEELLKISNISVEAGRIILDFYNKNLNITFKADESPLTQADLASNKFITDSIKKMSPNIPILSEEEFVEWHIRKEWKKYWLIDPLDGTKEFIKRNGEFTVNVALINDGFPIFGSVYAPFKKELYWAYKNLGAWKSENKASEFQIFTKLNTSNKRIVISRSHPNEKVTEFINQYDSHELIRMGSSLKLCCIAEGKADIYPRLGPTSEWDIGAAQCVVEEAGGSVLQVNNNKRLMYNKENILNPFFIVSA